MQIDQFFGPFYNFPNLRKEQTMSTAAQTPWLPPRPKPELLETNPALVAEYCSWFVNRRAYTRQSDRPNPDNNRYYYFQPKREGDQETARPH